jgi:hypothetical protein
LLIVALGLAMLPACGGSSSSTPQTRFQPTTAVLTLSTTATSTIPAGTTINSYNVTIPLPAGVTVKTMPGSSETGTGVVTAPGIAAGALISGVYTAATGTLPGIVKVYMISAAGLAPGDFCIVNADINAGYYPTASSFAPPTLDDATGLDSVPNTVILTGQLSLSATAVVH